MDNVKVLINENLLVPTADLLANSKIGAHNFERPQSPIVIFYLGNNSSGYYKEMKNDLYRGWGESGDCVMHIFASDPERFKETMTGPDGDQLEVYKFQTVITDLLSNQGVFQDMTRIKVYCILDTDNMSEETFEKWYMTIKEIEEILPVGLLSALIVIFNESIQNMAVAKGIRKRLLKIFEEGYDGVANKHRYDAVYLFSNHLRNGGFVNLKPDSQSYEEYNLFADLVLITNTNSLDHNERVANLYSRSVPAFSAAYSSISKPIKDIVVISLKMILEAIGSEIDKTELDFSSDEEIIKRMLNINNGRIQVVDNFYRDYIIPELPKNEIFDYLPGKFAYQNMTYKDVSNATMGSLEILIQKNYIETAKRIINQNKALLFKQLKADILSRVNFNQYKSFILSNKGIDMIVNNIINDLDMRVSIDKHNVVKAAEVETKYEVVNLVKPLIIEMLNELRQNANIAKNNFALVLQSVESMNIAEESDLRQNLMSFYSSKVEMFLCDAERLRSTIQEIFTGPGQINDVIASLRKLITQLIDNDPIYKKDFVDEFIERMDSLGTRDEVGSIIASGLTSGLSNKLAFYSINSISERYYEAYFVNSSTKYSSSGETLQNYLKKHGEVPKTFFDTRSNNLVESIWFYKCSKDNISA